MKGIRSDIFINLFIMTMLFVRKQKKVDFLYLENTNLLIF